MNGEEEKKEGIQNTIAKSHYISKSEYLKLMEGIQAHIQSELANRLDQYEKEMIRFHHKNAEKTGKELSLEVIETLK